MKQKSLGKQDNLNEKSASTGSHIWGTSGQSLPFPSCFWTGILSWEGLSGERGASTDLMPGEIHPLLPPTPPTCKPLPSAQPFHRSEMLTLQAIRFMNMTLKGKKPSHKPRTMLSSLLRSLKRSWEEETPVELQPDCDWCVPISSSLLSLWMARTASGL